MVSHFLDDAQKKEGFIEISYLWQNETVCIMISKREKTELEFLIASVNLYQQKCESLDQC